MIEEAFESVIKELEERLNKLGLYMINAEIGIVTRENQIVHPSQINEDYSLEEIVKNPQDHSIYLSSVFQLSDLCWSDRVLNPEKHQEDKEFRAILPTEFEVTLESMKDELLNWDEED